MNYHDYDSNGKKKGFNFLDLFRDRSYRSRMILVLYFLFFLVLIIGVRVSMANSSKEVPSSNGGEEKIPGVVEPPGEEENSSQEEEENPFKESFSYISGNNYHFKYILYYGEEVFETSGKRYENKFDFTLSNGEEFIHYLGSKNLLKGKRDSDTEYSIVEFPYYYVNYFDEDVLLQLLKKSVKLSNDTYEIQNKDLLSLMDVGMSGDISSWDLPNTIHLHMKNNIIVSLELDLTNFARDVEDREDLSSVRVELEYSDFHLIDDFGLEFD